MTQIKRYDVISDYTAAPSYAEKSLKVYILHTTYLVTNAISQNLENLPIPTFIQIGLCLCDYLVTAIEWQEILNCDLLEPVKELSVYK